MTYQKISLFHPQPAQLKLIAGCLKKGKIVVLPTDTIYGLSCLATDLKALKKISRLKKRTAKKPLAVVVGGWPMIKKYVFVSGAQEKIMHRAWAQPGRATTFVLRHRGNLPLFLTAGSDGLALRLPKSNFLTKICMLAGAPLASTSLNLAGQEPIRNPQDISLYFKNPSQQPDLVVEAGLVRRRRASRLIDLREENRPIILRK